MDGQGDGINDELHSGSHEVDYGVEKVWETIGKPKLIIYSWYRMTLLVNESNGKTEADLSIFHEKPKGFINNILCFFLADWYCRWCLKKMLRDAKKRLPIRMVNPLLLRRLNK